MSGSARSATLRLSVAVLAASCAVFPDHAVLPSVPGSEAGAGGESAQTTSATGGAETPASPGGAAGEGGTSAGAPPGAIGGAGAGGEGGHGGSIDECRGRQVRVTAVATDTWIDAGASNARHGEDAVLRVFAGTPERRALFRLTLPAAPPGLVASKATFVLRLQANANATLQSRQLGLFQLGRPLNADRATWRVAGPGDAWNQEGADFGARLGQADIPAGTASGELEADVTEAITQLSPQFPLDISLILLETGLAPPAPGELTFVSADTADDGAPAVVVEYCEPF